MMDMYQMNNPLYQMESKDDFDYVESEELIGDDETIAEMEQDKDLEILQCSFDKLNSCIVFDNIDVSNLNLRRVIEEYELNDGPGTKDDNLEDGEAYRVSKMKIASLEGFGDLKETTDYVQLFSAVVGEANTSEERSHRVNESLINYFALLGSQSIDSIDIDFVQKLTNAADLNTRDVHGQTIMHEVAREWSTGIANLLLLKGMDIDIADNWGRTPLFVAVASNHVQMVKWLIEKGADKNHKTMEGQGQTPIHFAAKHNSIDAFKVLMDLGVNPLLRDDQGRTPFFVAAHAGHQKMCKFMLDLDLPSVSYAKNGESTIDHIISRLPTEMAVEALNQFIAPSSTAGKWKLYLSCLGKRRWKLLSQHHLNPTACKTEPPGPLEIILDRQNIELVMHPVILRLIRIKDELFAAKYTYVNIFIHCLFTLLWTLSVSLFKEDETWYSSTTVLVLTAFAQILTFASMLKFYYRIKKESKATRDERDRVLGHCFLQDKYCHPRWHTDKRDLDRDKEAACTISYSPLNDGWNIVEVICLTMATVQCVVTFAYIAMCDSKCIVNRETITSNQYLSTQNLREARLYLSAVFVLLVWFRLNICFRFHQELGPFIQMLAGCAESLIRIGFLFFEFFIPFVVACWVIFGGDKLNEEDSDYYNVADLIYQIYLLTIVGDYEYDPLAEINKIASQIFVGVYALVVSIITINLYIGLLSEAYSSIMASASARAYLQQTKDIREYELYFPEEKHEFEIYLNKHCAPMIIEARSMSDEGGISARVIIKEAKISVQNISYIAKEIGREQENIRKDVTVMNEKLTTFKTMFSKEKSFEMMDGFDDVRRNEEKLIVRMSKNTDKGINKILQMIKDIPMK